MYKYYGKPVPNKFRRKNYSYKGRSHHKSSSEKRIIKKFLGQLIISIIIISLIILLKSINTSVTEQVSSTIRNIIYTKYDYGKGLNNIMDYGIDLKDKTLENIPVFNSDETSKGFARPIDGLIVSDYGEKYNPVTEKVSFQKGIYIKAIDMNTVKAIEDGVVEIVGEGDKGNLIKIQHSEQIFSIYNNLDDVYVKSGQRILKGERIGKIEDIENKLLLLEIWVDGEPVNPENYIDYGPKSI